MKYIPQSDEDQTELLKALGLSSSEQIFENIPKDLRTKSVLDYPAAQSEIDIRRSFLALSQLSPMPSVSFAGCGVYHHDIPSIVPFLQGRSEFSTAYTPYQPEITQGLLQAIFEFQSLAAMLTECELSNASLYDGATSLAEGVLMGLRLKKKSEGKILISDALHPFYDDVLKVYLKPFESRVARIPLSGDRADLDALKTAVTSADVLVTQSPNVFGVIENEFEIGKIIKGSEAIWVTSTMEPFSWGLLRGAGAYGAHIVTGEGQSFGNAPFLGGSSFGFFCTRNEFLRNLPGRLVGETLDELGRRAYTLTFATREQFIRRDKATSNICTNQNLNMLAGLIHMITLGKKGIRDVAIRNFSAAEYAKKSARGLGLKISASPTFNEFVVETKSPSAELVQKAAEEGWVLGVDLGRLKESWKHKLLIHVNELHTRPQVEQLLGFLKKSL